MFEQSGIGADDAYRQALWGGSMGAVFTLIALKLIDKVAESYGWYWPRQASQPGYSLTDQAIDGLANSMNGAARSARKGITFDSDTAFKQAIVNVLGNDALSVFESELSIDNISLHLTLILVWLLGFVASITVSMLPVVWAVYKNFL